MAIVAIVGRPNVGKSTLFNRLVGRREAIVDNIPGVTRDRHYGEVEWGLSSFTLVDTGGFEDEDRETIAVQVRRQVEVAIAEAEAVIFVCDARSGLTPLDEDLMRRLRGAQKPVFVAVNKIDSAGTEELLHDFHALGTDRLYAVSAAHGLGMWELAEAVASALPEAPAAAEGSPEEVRVAVVGRPNVGKSSLINRILGYERVVVSEQPGTTRDAVDTRLEWQGKPYILVDTAGIRRKGKLSGRIEHYGTLRALKAMERADVCLLLIDTAEGLTDQDMKIAAQAAEMGRGLVVALNKWDLIPGGPLEGARRREQTGEALQFLGKVPLVPTSATEGTGLNEALQATAEIKRRLDAKISTGLLNRALEAAVASHEPPTFRGKRVKFYYMTQVGNRPPRFLVFANYPKAITQPYRRYLTNRLRERLDLEAVPVQLIIRPRVRNSRT
ncbi:MAG: ribosome biogenesis GTPase Der [Pseudomonadota bacterium]